MELQRARERGALHEGTPGLGDPEEGRHRHPEPRRHHVPPGLRGIEGPGGSRERGAEARPAIPHGQAFHLQLPDRDELVQLAVPGAERGGIERHVDPPEGQRERAAPRDDLRLSAEAKAAVSAQLYRSAAVRSRGSNRPGAAPPLASGKRKA